MCTHESPVVAAEEISFQWDVMVKITDERWWKVVFHSAHKSSSSVVIEKEKAHEGPKRVLKSSVLDGWIIWIAVEQVRTSALTQTEESSQGRGLFAVERFASEIQLQAGKADAHRRVQVACRGLSEPYH